MRPLADVSNGSSRGRRESRQGVRRTAMPRQTPSPAAGSNELVPLSRAQRRYARDGAAVRWRTSSSIPRSGIASAGRRGHRHGKSRFLRPSPGHLASLKRAALVTGRGLLCPPARLAWASARGFHRSCLPRSARRSPVASQRVVSSRLRHGSSPLTTVRQ